MHEHKPVVIEQDTACPHMPALDAPQLESVDPAAPPATVNVAVDSAIDSP